MMPENLVRISEVANEIGVSVSWIRRLADEGAIPSTRSAGGHRLFDLAEVRAAIARRRLPGGRASLVESLGPPSWYQELTVLGLAEHEVWREVARDQGIDPNSSPGRIVAYAFMEMLNNAIDHSGSAKVAIGWWTKPDVWCFEIRDYGVGAYPKLRTGLGLGSEFEAVQELSKGKRTTDPEHHTGEGIFFTSKIVDLFQLTSAGVRWTVDNLREDMALGVLPATPGTTVMCQLDPQTDRVLAEVFRQFSRDHAFVLTRPVVKLFEIGTIFVSRSEARRLLDGLDTGFETVEVDFAGVVDVGQGFVDELLRVWPNTHPGTAVIPVNMNPAVEFMVNRGLARREE